MGSNLHVVEIIFSHICSEKIICLQDLLDNLGHLDQEGRREQMDQLDNQDLLDHRVNKDQLDHLDHLVQLVKGVQGGHLDPQVDLALMGQEES